VIPISKPVLGEEEMQRVRNVMLGGWITQGPEVAGFEKLVAEYTGARHAVACSSGTAALHMALVALGIGRGDEVIVPSMSFIASANAVCAAGAQPVFAEIEPGTFNLDPADVERRITPRTRAVMLVHQIGLPCDIDRFSELGRRRNVKIFEDAACALGSRYKDVRIGTHTELACFSFHPRKIISTGEGGMITTNDDACAAHLRQLRQHGMSVPDTIRHESRRVIFEEYSIPGYNYRLTDLQAAIGIEQMRRLEGLVQRRRELAGRYHRLLGGVAGVETLSEPDWARTNFQSYAVLLTGDGAVAREHIMQQMLDAGVATRRGIMTAHREPAYVAMHGAQSLPVTERASDRSLLLPLFPQMTEGEQDQVVAALQRALGR